MRIQRAFANAVFGRPPLLKRSFAASGALVWVPGCDTMESRSNGRLMVTEAGPTHHVATSSDAYLSNTKNIPAARTLTIVCICRFNNFNGTTFGVGGANNGAVLYSRRQVDADRSFTVTASNQPYAGNNMRIWAGCDTSATANGRANTQIVQAGRWYAIAASYNGNNSSTGISIAVNGQAETALYSTAGSFNDAWSTSIEYVGHNNQWPTSGDDDAQIDFRLFVRLPTALPVSVLNDLTKTLDAPFELFEQQQIWVPSSAGGYAHPTLSNATATDITATGFRPRVTYTFS